MRAAQVNLKQEVTRNDAMLIMNWMENHEVTMYLNELSNIPQEIRQAIDRVNMTIMTHLFNRNGSFYLVNTKENHPVGFLKLICNIHEAEMVIVIGDNKRWGHGLGKASIRQGLNIAFFQRRVPRVVAKIARNNVRSIKAFERTGFTLDKELTNTMLFSITQEEYLKQFR